MKALTLHQPWASLVALGVKTIETRSWSTKYRGRLAIHAGKTVPLGVLQVGEFEVEDDTPRGSSKQYLLRGPISWPYRLPLGFVVATCTLVDVVPVLAGDLADSIDWADLPYPRIESRTDYGPDFPDGWLDLWHPTMGSAVDPDNYGRSIPDQASYGDFSPGRFAWLLDDIMPMYSASVKGRQGLWEWVA